VQSPDFSLIERPDGSADSPTRYVPREIAIILAKPESQSDDAELCASRKSEI